MSPKSEPAQSEKPRRRRGKGSNNSSGSGVLISLEDGFHWWDLSQKQSGREESVVDATAVDISLVESYRKRADQLYELEITNFNNSSAGMSQSDARWMEDTMRKGTLQDRIAAMTVMCSQHPVHKLNVLDRLLSLAGKEKRVATMSGEALQNLFTSVYLPSNRKLIPLSRRPLSVYENNAKKTLSPRLLILWRFEELVKDRYMQFLSLITGWLNDTVGLDMHKLFAIRTAVDLLSERPEAEAQLLAMVVNKIGDPSKKGAAAAGHQLRRLLERHPAMTPIIAREVQQLAHRPHLSPKALYNCIIFLNQLKLTDSDDTKKDSLPASLIKTYFRLFEVAVQSGTNGKGDRRKKSKEQHSQAAALGKIRGRLLSALLTGVNRAQPYLPKSDEGMPMEHIDSLYRISHTAPPAATTQALLLLFQLAIGSSGLNDAATTKKRGKQANAAVDAREARKTRFYRALYSKLSDPRMLSGRHMTMFFNLLYRAMKVDKNETRVLVFSKTLLQTASHASPGVAAGSLFLISEVMKVHPSLKESETRNTLTEFDITKRDPDSALGESKSGSLWEASLLSCHFHPSVAKFSDSLSEITYKGDPCKDFSLAPFLDRFAYRNPKSKERLKKKFKLGESVAERKSGGRGLKAAAAAPVNDPSFLETKNISEMDQFFHKFFKERAKRDAWKGIIRAPDESNEDKYDRGSDSDPDEAEFAHKLAERMMEESGNGRVHYDDEDPDMEGWDDLKGDSDGYEDVDEDAAFSAMDKIAAVSEDDDHSSGDDEYDNEFAQVLEDSEDEEFLVESKSKKVKANENSFADASEYEDIINKSWTERSKRKDVDNENHNNNEVEPSQSMKKKRSSRKKH